MPKMMMTMTMTGGPSIDEYSFGSSSTSAASSTSCSDGVLEEAGIINGPDDDARFTPWSGVPYALAMAILITSSRCC